MLAAEATAGAGFDDADFFGRDAEGLLELLLNAEGVLGTGPNGELAVDPFGYGGAGFHGGVLDVGGLVGGGGDDWY